MGMLQEFVRSARKIVPRGWAPILHTSAHLIPGLQTYRAKTDSGDSIYIDLRQSMCLTIFFQKGQPHERGTEALLRYALRRGDTFVDVGANVGFYTRMASLLVGESGRVFAFEPLPSAIRLLKLNAAGLTNVIVETSAVGDRNGEADFCIRPEGDTSSLLAGGKGSNVSVSITSLDVRLLELEAAPKSVDFIKIDVEGAELSVLRGAVKTIEKYRPIVYLEFLPLYSDRYGFGYEDFVEFFEPRGYSLHWINHDGDGPELFSATNSTYLAAVPDGRSYLLRGN
jgi:FkbM family methyltransferase